MVIKQTEIIKTLRDRISQNYYDEALPFGKDLAKEFNVNIKTINKAIQKLSVEGLVERKPHVGTKIKKSPLGEKNQLIEIIFEGFDLVFRHPFWSNVWDGIISKLSSLGYRAILNSLEVRDDNGLLKLDKFTSFATAGVIVLGVQEKRLFQLLKEEHRLFISTTDYMDDMSIAHISVDFRIGIQEAIHKFISKKCTKIAFFGQTSSLTGTGAIHKYLTYCDVIQEYSPLDSRLIWDIKPSTKEVKNIIKKQLKTVVPDAILVAYSHQLPEVLEVIHELNLSIKVVACDGFNASSYPECDHIIAPLYQCGELAVQQLVRAIENGLPKPKSYLLPTSLNIKK